MATHSRVLARRIPGVGEPGGLPSMGSHRVGQDWSDLAAAAPAGGFMSSVKPYVKISSPVSCIGKKIPLMLAVIINNKSWSSQVGMFSHCHHSVAQSCLTWWPCGLQYARLLCPSSSPGACSNSCPFSRWCYPTIYLILCCPLLLLPSFLASGFFSNELALCIFSHYR